MKCIYLKKGNNTFASARRDESQNAGMNAFLSVAQRKTYSKKKRARKVNRKQKGIEIFLSVKHFQQAEQMIETLREWNRQDVDKRHQQFQSFFLPVFWRIRTKSDQLNMFGHKFLFFGIFLLIIDIRNRVFAAFGHCEILFTAITYF
jgi:hypothetical protein